MRGGPAVPEKEGAAAASLLADRGRARPAKTDREGGRSVVRRVRSQASEDDNNLHISNLYTALEKRFVRGFVNLLPALALHFCLALSEAFSQPTFYPSPVSC